MQAYQNTAEIWHRTDTQLQMSVTSGRSILSDMSLLWAKRTFATELAAAA